MPIRLMQPSFFDQDAVHTKLDRLKDPLVTINEIVDWDGFRETLERIRPQTDPRQGGRPPLDAVLMCKMIFLRHYYDLSLKQAEYQVLDRLSFRRFLGLNLEDPVPDTNTVWVYEERLIEHDLVQPLFRDLMAQIEAAGYLPRGGQIIDATIVEAPRRRNEPSGNDDDQGGQGRSDAQRRQANRDAHWTRKHGQSYFGYKDHLGVDTKHKLIRTFEVTPANRHDGHLLADLLDPDNSNADVWADSAYRSAENEDILQRRGHTSRITRPKPRNKPQTKPTERANRKKAQIRARVEHVCGGVKQGAPRQLVRSIGLGRATLRIGMKNLGYNIRRFGFLLTHVMPVHRTA